MMIKRWPSRIPHPPHRKITIYGWSTSARLGHAPPLPAAVRNVVGGAIAMAVTYGIGTVIGTTGL
jgi:vacuolar iron transporter family protein